MREMTAPRTRQGDKGEHAARSAKRFLCRAGVACSALMAAGLAWLSPTPASAQEILLTGPLKGKGAVKG